MIMSGKGGGGGSYHSGKIPSANALQIGLNKFPPTKWHQLGVQLNVPNSTLKAIEYNYMHAGGVGRCLSETLASWYNSNRNASWNEICAALHTVDEVVLEKEVAKKHGCSPVIVSHPQTTHVDLGEKDVTFHCEASGTPPLEYSWKFNGEVLKGKTTKTSTLTIPRVDRKRAGTYQCCVMNNFDDVASKPAELRIGRKVTEDSMYDLLKTSGIRDADWLVIAKQLGLTTEKLAGAFLKAWKDSDSVGPSWQKLAKALAKIGEGGGSGWYARASQQADRNAGFELTVATMCDTFKEVELKEPDWQTVSTKLGLDLYGPVSAEELYQVWCQHAYVPSWVKLSQALGKFQRYTRVADLAKKKAGVVLSSDSMRWALTEAGVKIPDWGRIGRELGLELKGRITASLFIEGWRNDGSEMSWERLARSLEGISRFELAKKARQKTGQVFSKSTMCRAFQEAGIQMPDWDKIGKVLGFDGQPVSASTFFESWSAYAQNCHPTWNRLAQALESVGNWKEKRAAVAVQAKEGEHVQLTKDNVCAVLHNAGIQSPDWEKIAKSLGLDAAILSSAFFTQWYAVARDRKPSWKALSTMLDNQKYPQAAMSVREMKGELELTVENIEQVVLEATIQWGKIAKGLGFQLPRSQNSLNGFVQGWRTFGHNCEPSWENLAVALESIGEYKLLVGKIQSKAGLEFNQDTVCTAFREAGFLLPEWAKIAKQLPVSMQLKISTDEFIKGWFAYTEGYQPSWLKLAQALERTDIPNYKPVAGKMWRNQGLLGHEAAVAIFSSCGIQHPVWGRIGKCLGLDSLILPTCFFKTWQDHARNCSPSWERLALALDRQYNHKQTAAIARGKEGQESLNKETLQKVVRQASTLPDWGKIANFLGFKQYVQGQITVNSFLEGWHTYARVSLPSWKLLSWALDNIREYKPVVKKILGNAGEALDAETLCELLTEPGVHAPDWEHIGIQLGLHIKGQISADDFFVAWCRKDSHASWIQLANAVEKVEEYKHAAQTVREKQVQELSKESMVAIFPEAGVCAPENWREIGVQLGLKLRGQLSAAMFFNGWSQKGSIHKPSWETLAVALSKISGYSFAAAKARDKAPLELSETNMCDIFKDAGDVDWPLICRTLLLTQNWINQNCLRQTLKRWYNNGGKPWSTWRKLAVVVENVYDSEAGQKLRQVAGVALKLNDENMSIVLKKAGIVEADWQDVAHALDLTQSFGTAGWLLQKGKNLLGFQCWTEVLNKWREQGSPVSWDKLADALQKKYGVDATQTILELSGEGGCPAIVEHPEDTKVAVGRKVLFECQAIGATPLTYSWLHNGTDITAKHEKKLEFIVRRGSGGDYSCRVENEFGSKKSASAHLTVGDSPQIKSIHTDPPGKKNIETGGTVSICCTASGEPPLRYTWLFTSSEAAKPKVLPNEDTSTLVIRAAKENDHQGSYQCRVTNDFNVDTSDSLKINVGNPPTIEKFDIDGTTKLSFRIDEKVNFSCEAKGTPPLHYIWHCNTEVIQRRRDNKLSVTATEKTEGEYYCVVENLFGSNPSEVKRIKVGTLPHIDVHPVIRGTVEPGEFLPLKCKATGKGALNYVWQHGNQTLVNETRPELIIKHVRESDQGTYSCRVTNAYGYATSNPAILKLTITQGELMKELGPHVAPRWYMLAVLLDIDKPIIDRISKGFTANENIDYSLSEVVEAWLEGLNATDQQLVLKDPSSSISPEASKMEPSRYWLQIYRVVKRMGCMTFARDLDAKYKLSAESASVHPEYEQTKENEEQQSKTESKPTPVDEDEMHRRFTKLIDKVQPLLATPDTDPTESCTTNESATDTSVSECQAYLHLIDFPPEETERIADLPSLFKLLTPYLNFQRFHIFEMIIGRFKSAEAREKTQKYREEHLDVYQAHVKLGRFALASDKQSPAVNPPFMRSFSLRLESKWATCTVQDLERLLTCLLPKSIGYTFVWFCKVYQVADDNSICLEYIVSPSVVDILTEEAEKKRGILRSAGILSLHVDGTPIGPKDVNGDEKVETFLKKLAMETVLPHGRLFQRGPLPVSESDTVQGLDSKPSDCPTEEVEDIPPEKSEIEKLQESLQERDKREAALKQSLEQAEIEIENHKSQLQEMQGKLRDKGNDIRNLQSVVKQHKCELEKTPLSALDQASKDLKQKLIDEGSRRAESHQYTMRQLGRVQTNLKSEVKTHVQAQIPELQLHMKEEMDAAVRQLRGEMERKLSDMRSEVLRQHEEREERHLRRIERNGDEILQLSRNLEEYRRGQLKWEIMREVQENGGRDKP